MNERHSFTRSLSHAAAMGQDLSTAMLLASFYGDLRTVESLVGRGVSVNLANEYGRTPLHRSAFSGHLPVVQYLVAQKAAIDARNTYQWTPAHSAASEGHAEVLDYLLSCKADARAVTDQGATMLHLAAENGHVKMLEHLISTLDASVSELDLHYNTPLHRACDNGHLAAVEFLVEHGAAINARNGAGETPLFLAAKEGAATCVAYLLSKAADIEIANVRMRSHRSVCAIAATDLRRLLVARAQNDGEYPDEVATDKATKQVFAAHAHGKLEGQPERELISEPLSSEPAGSVDELV